MPSPAPSSQPFAKPFPRPRACAAWLSRPLVLGLLLAALIAMPALVEASQVVITTAEGRQLEGELVRETGSYVALRISGIEARIDRERIVSIEQRPARAPQPTPLADGVRLADAGGAASGQSQRAQREQFPRLTQNEINRIKVFEVDLDDEPRITIPRATLNAFLDQYAGERGVPRDRDARARFLRAAGHEQLSVMFDARAREFYGEVIVRDEPPALIDFRQRIHRQHILNYCATNQCHGGEDAPGNLRLERDTAVDAVYTNFYILHAYESEAGYMIDRDRPDESLLVQYALPRNLARRPHPQVPGWRARFTDRSDRWFEHHTEFIDSLWRPRPDYGIDYHPPGMPEPDENES